MRVAGLISGTSVDGIDVAVVDIGDGVHVVATATVAYPAEVREAILSISNATAHVSSIARLNFLLAELFAEALVKSGVPLETIELIGSHGQTIFHEGQPVEFLGRKIASTMQIGEAGRERPVVWVDEGRYVDVSDQFDDFDEAFFDAAGIERVRVLARERAAAGRVSAFSGERIGAPVARPHQIVCVGLNYADHAEETGQAIPAEPILFNKAPNTLIGPNDDVRLPRGSVKTDWEVELGVVIGRRSSYLETDADALAAVAGYTLVNDVSEREFQNERGGQWVKGKSAETFNPAGPWLATPDEIGDVRDLDLWLDVSGVRRQTGSTKTMIFDPLFIVRYISQFMVLEPGDLINTGTPPGVGLGMKPPLYLAEGDVMELGVTGLGTQRQRVIGPR